MHDFTKPNKNGGGQRAQILHPIHPPRGARQKDTGRAPTPKASHPEQILLHDLQRQIIHPRNPSRRHFKPE
jgi:hypothetical protein